MDGQSKTKTCVEKRAVTQSRYLPLFQFSVVHCLFVVIFHKSSTHDKKNNWQIRALAKVQTYKYSAYGINLVFERNRKEPMKHENFLTA